MSTPARHIFINVYGITLVILPLLITCNKSKINEKNIPTYPADTARKKNISEAVIDSPQTIVYLSIDDGPSDGSPAVNALAWKDSLDINVFIIGKFAFRNEADRGRFELYRENPFIEIGNHSFTHANGHYRLYYSHPLEVLQDFLMNADTLQLEEHIARLPGRNCWRIDGRSRDDLEDGKAAADSLAAKGYSVFGWDVEWRSDSAGKIIESADEMFNRISHLAESGRSFTPHHIVILFHDAMFADTSNMAAIQSFIGRIKSAGKFRFDHLSSYPEHQHVIRPN